MAEVYVAKARGIGGFEKLVAIKVIHPRYSEDEHFVRLLVEEAKISVLLTHVNIVQIFDLGCIEDTYFIAMEYIEGADAYRLQKRAAEERVDLPIDVCTLIASEVCNALDYAHRKRDAEGKPLGIVHRDVSPQNVLISFAGEVKLVDFGIAKAALRSGQTEAGVIKGKYYYMSPEQAWGERTDQRSDIFSLGIVLYELLTGEMLYHEDNIPALLEKVRRADIPPPGTKRTEIHDELGAIVMKALAKEPRDRYPSALDMGQALTQYLFGQAMSPAPARLAQVMALLFPDEVKSHSALTKLDVPEETEQPEPVKYESLVPMRRDDFAPGRTKSAIFDLGDDEPGEDDATRNDVKPYRALVEESDPNTPTETNTDTEAPEVQPLVREIQSAVSSPGRRRNADEPTARVELGPETPAPMRSAPMGATPAHAKQPDSSPTGASPTPSFFNPDEPTLLNVLGEPMPAGTWDDATLIDEPLQDRLDPFEPSEETTARNLGAHAQSIALAARAAAAPASAPAQEARAPAMPARARGPRVGSGAFAATMPAASALAQPPQPRARPDTPAHSDAPASAPASSPFAPFGASDLHSSSSTPPPRAVSWPPEPPFQMPTDGHPVAFQTPGGPTSPSADPWAVPGAPWAAASSARPSAWPSADASQRSAGLSTAGYTALLAKPRVTRRLVGLVIAVAVLAAVGIGIAILAQPGAPPPVLEVISVPPGASVRLDGETVGQVTPLRIEDGLTVGRTHRIEVERDGYETWSTAFLPTNGVVRQIAVLRPLTAFVRVETTPRGAQIWIDGALRGTSPLDIGGVPLGRPIDVRATLSDYADETRHVIVLPRDRRPIVRIAMRRLSRGR